MILSGYDSVVSGRGFAALCARAYSPQPVRNEGLR